MSVAVIMGSDSDYRVMQDAVDVLDEFGVPCEVRVLSAHRTPHDMLAWASSAAEQDLRVVIAGAGGAAHLPGMVAAATRLPVIGVPISLGNLDGLDALLSVAQMPAGVPVATVAIDGARNAAHLALRILGVFDARVAAAVEQYQDDLAAQVREKNGRLRRHRDDQRTG